MSQSNPFFTDADGETFEAIPHRKDRDYPRPMIEIFTDEGQGITFYADEAAGMVQIIREAASILGIGADS